MGVGKTRQIKESICSCRVGGGWLVGWLAIVILVSTKVHIFGFLDLTFKTFDLDFRLDNV